MGLPAAVGGRLATRLLSGVGINTAFGGLNRFAVGETLEQNGYADMAKQYRVFDGQAILIDSVLGAAFGGAHHFAARGNSVDARADSTPSVDDGTTALEPAATAEIQPQEQPSVSPAQESGVVLVLIPVHQVRRMIHGWQNCSNWPGRFYLAVTVKLSPTRYIGQSMKLHG